MEISPALSQIVEELSNLVRKEKNLEPNSPAAGHELLVTADARMLAIPTCEDDRFFCHLVVIEQCMDDLEELVRIAKKTLELQTRETASVLVVREYLSEGLKKLASLQEAWQQARPDTVVNNSKAGRPPYAVVFITTDPDELERYRLTELMPIDDKSLASSADNKIDTISERSSRLQLESDSLPYEVAEKLLNQIANEHRLVMAEGHASELLPGFSNDYTVIASSLTLLESFLDWILHAQTMYLRQARSLLDIIQRELMDRLQESLSRFPGILENSDITWTPELPKALQTVVTLRQFIQRLSFIEVGPQLEAEWKRLQQPLQEVLIDLDSLYDELTRSCSCGLGRKGHGCKGASALSSKIDDNSMEWANNVAPSISDIVTKPPVHLLFYFKDDPDQSFRRAYKSMDMPDDFTAESVRQSMHELTADVKERKPNSRALRHSS